MSEETKKVKPKVDGATAAAAVRQAGTHLTREIGKRRKNAQRKAEKLEKFTDVDGESTLYGIVEKNLGGTTLLVKTIPFRGSGVKERPSQEVKCRIPGKFRGKCKILITAGDYVIITIDGSSSVNGEIVTMLSQDSVIKRGLKNPLIDAEDDDGNYGFEAEEDAEIDIDAI